MVGLSIPRTEMPIGGAASTKLDRPSAGIGFLSMTMRNQPAIKLDAKDDKLRWPFIPFPEDWYASC
jgi:hypothetical protein